MHSDKILYVQEGKFKVTVVEEMNLWYFKWIRMCREVGRQAQINKVLLSSRKKVTHYQSERCLIDFSQQRVFISQDRMDRWLHPCTDTTDMEESYNP